MNGTRLFYIGKVVGIMIDRFIEKWSEFMIDLATSADNAYWLISHASYVFRTENIVWAVDPVLQADEHRLVDKELANCFEHLKFVLVTHLHADHFDAHFLKAMENSKCMWILPSFMTAEQRAKLPIDQSKIIYAEPGDTIGINGVRINVHKSLHRDTFNGVVHGVDENGYMVTVAERRYLFPGDVRNYPKAPVLPATDDLFAHVWLGRENALTVKKTDIDTYAEYFSKANAKRIWLGHLYDYTRHISEMWTDEHAAAVSDALHLLQPSAVISAPHKLDKQLL